MAHFCGKLPGELPIEVGKLCVWKSRKDSHEDEGLFEILETGLGENLGGFL